MWLQDIKKVLDNWESEYHLISEITATFAGILIKDTSGDMFLCSWESIREDRVIFTKVK